MGDGVDEDLFQRLDNGLGAFFVHDDSEQFAIVMENCPVARVFIFDDVVHGSGVWMVLFQKRQNHRSSPAVIKPKASTIPHLRRTNSHGSRNQPATVTRRKVNIRM